nr:MAG TPA: hypothetical protein [Caudoviricetes sp.]
MAGDIFKPLTMWFLSVLSTFFIFLSLCSLWACNEKVLS